MSYLTEELKCALGGALMGSIINISLLGVVSVQTVRYFEVFGRKDRLVNKAAVSASGSGT